MVYSSEGPPMDSQASNAQIELESMLHYEDAEHKTLSYSLLVEITKDFSEELKIGSGGFADVYKAKLDHSVVAVKKLRNTSINEAEFHRELDCLMKVKHKNIVRFLGHCAETQLNAQRDEDKKILAEDRRRLLCFEFVPKGTLYDYIKDKFEELEWTKCYQIIEGICQGLNYLHREKILHLDLKPGNILLDEDMMPKITDFGLSRCFEDGKSHITASKVGGTEGYWAPEFSSYEMRTESGNYKITDKFDLYSLGVIILEMLTGKRGCSTIEDVRKSWSCKPDISWWEQIQVCAEIGIECIDRNPANRPRSMKDIIDRLFKTKSSTQVTTAGGTSKFLVLQSSVLRFLFEPNKVVLCPLQLTNNTDKHVAFRLMDKSGESSFLRLPLYGVLLPRTPYTIIVTTQEKQKLPRKWITDVILESATLILENDNHIKIFDSHPEKFFQEMKSAVQEVELKALYTLPQDVTTSTYETILPKIKIICKVKDLGKYSLDTNQEKQWIMIGQENGHVGFWDYSQRKVGSLQIPATNVSCIRFIERKQWIVAGTEDGYVHVYSYETKKQKIKSFRVFTGSHGCLYSLAVHPTLPYLLSLGTHMKLWNWDNGWECTQTFEVQSTEKFYHATFNPNDTASKCKIYGYYNGVRVWSLHSRKSKYAQSKHSGKVNCLDFFTCHDQEFLVTGLDDHTAKIWCLQKKICAYTLDAFVSPVTAVLYQPNLYTLIVGSKDGAIYLWSTKNCRTYSYPPTLTRIINIGCVGSVYHLACAMGSVVIGKGNTVAIMDIDNVNDQEQSTDYSKQESSADTRQHARDTTSKEIGSINKIPILDIHPLELRFPYHPNEPISCSLDLTNNSDENVAFRLVDMGGKSPWCFTKLPLYGIVPQRCTYSLIVTTKEEMKLKEKKDFDLVIQSSLLEDKYIIVFQNQSESDQFFEEAKESGSMVHEVILKPIYLQYEDITSTDEKISVKYNPDYLHSIDAHPTEPWILTGHRSGYARVWNEEMKYAMNSLKISDHAVSIVKFIARKEWFVAVTHDGDLHVYDCACVTKIEKIRQVGPDLEADRIYRRLLRTDSHPYPTDNQIILAIHPTLPSVLSPGIQLLDWDLGWNQIKIFWGSGIRTVAFNPGDQNCFAGGCENSEVKVWRFDSRKHEYSLRGHFGIVNCIDFIRHGRQQYLVSGSKDCTAKIWDLRKRECICTLQAMSPVLCVFVHPTLSVLITGTEHGIIHVWSSTDFRLKRIINLGGGGPVVGLACLRGTQRVVIGQESAISIMDIYADGALVTDRMQRRQERRCARAVAKQAKAQLIQAEAAERIATQEQQELRHKSATQGNHSQTKARHGGTEKPSAPQEQQALPPKSVTAKMQRRQVKRRARVLAKRAQAESSEAEAELDEKEELAAILEQQLLDSMIPRSARRHVPSLGTFNAMPQVPLSYSSVVVQVDLPHNRNST